MLSRNTAGVWNLDEEVKDVNTEIMKFEALVGKSLWWVNYSSEHNVIVTGGVDSSIKLWKINSHKEIKSEEKEDVIKYEYDLKQNLSEMPFEISKSEEYFFRSLSHLMVDEEFYLFAATNIGTIMQIHK